MHFLNSSVSFCNIALFYRDKKKLQVNATFSLNCYITRLINYHTTLVDVCVKFRARPCSSSSWCQIARHGPSNCPPDTFARAHERHLFICIRGLFTCTANGYCREILMWLDTLQQQQQTQSTRSRWWLCSSEWTTNRRRIRRINRYQSKNLLWKYQIRSELLIENQISMAMECVLLFDDANINIILINTIHPYRMSPYERRKRILIISCEFFCTHTKRRGQNKWQQQEGIRNTE